MRVHEYSGDVERRILVAMATDDRVLGRIVGKWNKTDGWFRAPYANMIGDWCVSFFRKYGTAPGRRLHSRFEQWASNRRVSKEMVAALEMFFEAMQGELDSVAELNSEYHIDLAARHFNSISIERLANSVLDGSSNGSTEQDSSRILGWRPIDLGVGVGVDPLLDAQAIKDALESTRKPIMRFPGPLGEFFGDELERDAFIAFMGPEKRGKTWWLLTIAFRAVQSRLRVAFFQCGDLSQKQQIRRISIRASGHPLRVCKLAYPKRLERTEDGEIEIDLEHRSYRGVPPWPWVAKKSAEFQQRHSRSTRNLFRLSCHPNSTISAYGIDDALASWERDDWVADVIVIDYADILAPPPGVKDKMDRVNETWKALRSLSQKRHALVVTGTQANASSYRTNVLGMKHFSEDHRKFAHVTGMVGINETQEEKDEGRQRLNWLVLREDAYNSTRPVHVAGCRELANPAILSCW